MVPLSRVTGSLAPGLLAPALRLILQDGPNLIWCEKPPCYETLRSPDWTKGFTIYGTGLPHFWLYLTCLTPTKKKICLQNGLRKNRLAKEGHTKMFLLKLWLLSSTTLCVVYLPSDSASVHRDIHSTFCGLGAMCQLDDGTSHRALTPLPCNYCHICDS
ncbi:hypothetical protein K438DRAFT_1934436 [Mycena galopus ATCC 62051]|nr:hypothetical protein K438DRAFT_1934436 [Mycena galopus ATCC 62051]